MSVEVMMKTSTYCLWPLPGKLLCLRSLQGDTSVVFLFVLCFGVDFCAV